MKVIISRIWTWTAANDRTLLVVFAAVAGLYALFEYTMKTYSDKEIETGKFVELYTAAPMLNARLDLDVIMRNPAILSAKPETYNDVLKSIEDNDQKLIRSVFTHLGFFDSLSICVENNICAKTLACQYFFDDCQAFIENTRPILNSVSERTINLLSRFAHVHCIAEFRAYCSGVNSPDCAMQ
jgi:hypothetical protein